jgi:hypothetical protein
MKNIILLMLSVLFYTSCDVYHTEILPSFVHTYNDYSDITAELTDSGNIVIRASEVHFECNWVSKGEKKKLYNSLCLTYNDLSYNKKVDIMGEYPEFPGYHFKNGIKKLIVTSNNEFDNSHPTGVSLNDLIRFSSLSPIKFISSNYKSKYDWTKYSNGYLRDAYVRRSEEYHPIEDNLSELSETDFFLLGDGWSISFICRLSFVKQAETIKEHKLTVTIVLNDGRVFRPTVVKVFE